MSNKSLNEIVLDLIDYLKVSQPNADTKVGTVIRDLFIDLPASQLSLLYDEISAISNLQSLRLVSGTDLDKLAQNLGASKKVAKPSSGTALFTFSSIPATIAINSNQLVTAQNGYTFSINNGVAVESSKANYYKSVATKYRNDLDYLGISDQYAVEVSVSATTPGTIGNISKYSLIKVSIPGVSNVTNVFPFSGGVNQEDDTTFKNRVLAIFSGSNIGTSLGYKNTALTNAFVQDALVISPGDVLMTRDGTQVSTNSAGVDVITSEGTGGKIDVIILGTNENQNTDTFIYKDKSNNNDPTNILNNVILGQIVGDENKTITRKRIDNIAAGVLPSQPIDSISEVTGSLSGGNFVAKTTDLLGRVFGNYELVKDTGIYNGSPWAQDYFRWINDRISSFPEDTIKSQYNGQDITSFTDVLSIPKIQQNISINNENSNVSNNDRSIVQLLHTPSSAVSRVLNTNTGERYTVINQNFDGTTPFNTTGRIQISGNTLPSSSDILQTDYTWIIDYDQFSDYDGKILSNNPRSSIDSIDWGISNSIRSEKIKFSLNGDLTFYTGAATQPISSILNANIFKSIIGTISASSIVNFSDRLSINLSELNDQINNINSIKIANTQIEIYNTSSNDGLFINNRVIVGVDIKYNSTIILPSNTDVLIGDIVEIIYNTVDAFNVSNSTGSFIDNKITIPATNIESLSSNIYLYTSYIASTQDINNYGINNLPISRFGNGFINNNNVGNKNIIPSNCIQRQNQIIQKNISNQYYVKLDLLSTEYELLPEDIISVIHTYTEVEYWNANAPGVINIDTDGKYLIILSGLNLPSIGDNATIFFEFLDKSRTQPFTFSNKLIKYNSQTLDFDFSTNVFSCQLNTFTTQSSLDFDIIDPTTGLVVGSNTDGVIFSTDGYENIVFNSALYDFSSLSELTSKQILIKNAANLNNNGLFYIKTLISAHSINISPLMNKLSGNQISVIRLSDNKDIWNPSTCSFLNNILTFPGSTQVAQGDKVIILCFDNNTLRQSPTRLAITLSDQLVNSGVLTISGTTITKAYDVVFSATQIGLKQNLLSAMKTWLNISSTSSILSDTSIVRLLRLEKVTATSNNEVISTDVVYDIFGTELLNNILYSNEMNYNLNLSNMEFILPSTSKNISNQILVGDKLRVTFAYSTVNDNENLYFTKNGTLYTNKKFAFINKMYVSSGFNSSTSARFTISLFTQPSTGSRYRAYYDYLAPKQNERILIRSNFNQAIQDTTLSIEGSRPLNADVLVRAAKQILVNATINIVVKSSFLTSAAIVIQNVKDKITNSINTGILGDSINSSDLIAAAQGIDGVDRARIISFNKNGEVGQVLTITAKNDSYFLSNIIVINQEVR